MVRPEFTEERRGSPRDGARGGASGSPRGGGRLRGLLLVLLVVVLAAIAWWYLVANRAPHPESPLAPATTRALPHAARTMPALA